MNTFVTILLVKRKTKVFFLNGIKDHKKNQFVAQIATLETMTNGESFMETLNNQNLIETNKPNGKNFNLIFGAGIIIFLMFFLGVLIGAISNENIVKVKDTQIDYLTSQNEVFKIDGGIAFSDYFFKKRVREFGDITISQYLILKNDYFENYYTLMSSYGFPDLTKKVDELQFCVNNLKVNDFNSEIEQDCVKLSNEIDDLWVKNRYVDYNGFLLNN